MQILVESTLSADSRVLLSRTRTGVVARFPRVLALTVVLTWGAAPVILAEAQEAHRQTTRVDLGLDISTPGGKAMVPLLLQAPSGVEIGAIASTIMFPTDLVTFETVTLGDAGETANAGVETEVGPAEGEPKKSVLTVRLTGTTRAIPTGTVASIVFAIAKSASNGSVTLQNAPQAFTFGASPQPVNAVEGVDGEIQVGAPPVIACFFYMH